MNRSSVPMPRPLSDPSWIDPTGVNLPDATPGASWDGNIPMGAEILALYLIWAVGSPGSHAGNTHPLKQLVLPYALNDGFGAVFATGRVSCNASPSSGGNYQLIYGGFQLRPTFRLTPRDTRIDLVIALPGYMANLPGGPGPYQWLRSGQIIDGDVIIKGTSLLWRIP